MAGFLVSASTGVMNSLLCKLGTLLSDEYKLLKGVRKEIGILRDELSSMNSLLHKIADVDGLDVQKKEWMKKVRELAYDIEDCIDIFIHQLCHRDGEKGFIRKAIRKIRKLRARHQIAVQIQELKTRVMEESARRDRYKLDVPTSSRRLVDIDPRLPALYTEAKSLVGINTARDEVIQWLTNRDWKCCSAEQVNVVSIVGFGGLGKTTLARQVYYQNKDRFQCAAFVSVSQTPDVSRILSDILSQVGSARMRICNSQNKLIEKIREQLSHKCYLVVVDDIWSIQVWDIIKCAFVQSKNGSRVIITTRIEQVAATCCSYCHNHVYKMKPLSDLDSRKLFFQRIFGSEDACPEQYKKVSHKILRKCGGVPLVIISIASLLASQECMQTEKWENIQKFLMFELETSPTLGWMRHALNLSYNDLPHPLKTCFLYLAVYPEDYKIEKVNLLRRWMAEGFVSYQYGLSPEEVAESFFNELINRNMIQPAGFEYGELTYCQVHDVMLDFILSKSIEENFITMIDEQRSTKGTFEIRRLCLQFKNAYLVPGNMNLAQVRSLTIFGFDGCMPFSRFVLLRVLDLYCDQFDGTQCLDCSALLKLFQLRYFRIARYQLKLNQIGELSHLETLDIGDAIVSSIPSDIAHLKSLRHLVIPTDAKLPKGIGRMGALNALGFFDLTENHADNIRDLGELTSLRDLDLIRTKHIMEAQDPSENLKLNFLINSLRKLTNLRSLYFSNLDRTVVSPKYDFLSCWFPAPCNLQRLSLSFCTVSKIPEWISQLNKLTSLKIKVQDLPRYGIELLGELPCLSYLDLSATEEPPYDIIFHNNAYPRLREFGFSYMFSNVTFEPLSMAKLQILHLTFYMCKQQKASSSLTGIENLLNLEQLTARIYNRGNIGASFRDAILRHPRSRNFNILFPRCAKANSILRSDK